MAVFCRKCAKQRGWDTPAVRVSADPCDFCGGFDQIERFHRQTGKTRVENQRNYSQDDRNLPDTAAERAIQQGVQ